VNPNPPIVQAVHASREVIFGVQRVWGEQRHADQNVANKIKMLVWLMVHDSLQVKMNIARRGVVLDTRCPVCWRFDEDPGHLFFKCKEGRLCWRLLNMEEIRIELMAQTSAKAVLEHIWSFDVDCQSKIIIFMWCWWSARNKINAGEKTKTALQIISDVFFHLQACRDAVSIEKRVTIPVCKPKWRPPPERGLQD
jgi:hypothetical protein